MAFSLDGGDRGPRPYDIEAMQWQASASRRVCPVGEGLVPSQESEILRPDCIGTQNDKGGLTLKGRTTGTFGDAVEST